MRIWRVGVGVYGLTGVIDSGSLRLHPIPSQLRSACSYESEASLDISTEEGNNVTSPLLCMRLF